MRDRLASLLSEAEGLVNNDLPTVEQIADYLIEHGVIVPQWETTSDALNEKQAIEEMANEICGICHAYKNCVNTTPCTMAYVEAEGLCKNKGYRKQSAEEWIFKNSPFEMLDMAFKRLFPDVKYTAYFETDIRDNADGNKVCGLTDFSDDGEITIFIDTDLSINNAVEIFAHELAHAGVGVAHDHDEVWEKAFDDLFEVYNRLGEEMFSSNINAPKGEDYSNALAEMKGGE